MEQKNPSSSPAGRNKRQGGADRTEHAAATPHTVQQYWTWKKKKKEKEKKKKKEEEEGEEEEEGKRKRLRRIIKEGEKKEERREGKGKERRTKRKRREKKEEKVIIVERTGGYSNILSDIGAYLRWVMILAPVSDLCREGIATESARHLLFR
ncbi:protein PXR1-like [Haliotis rufescens]|uniref:protein PXR1-like n=1 Tax=Haliotis rufescens TaxID=6454 RepID=UPI00201F4A2B|nr:protein PXR1-like [Haliotis rufescens]